MAEWMRTPTHPIVNGSLMQVTRKKAKDGKYKKPRPKQEQSSGTVTSTGHRLHLTLFNTYICTGMVKMCIITSTSFSRAII